MIEHRIYGRSVPLSSERVWKIFDKRAAQASVGDLGIVLLGNQDPKFLKQRNDHDRNNILPLLNIGPKTRVLDIGCGNGRWAALHGYGETVHLVGRNPLFTTDGR